MPYALKNLATLLLSEELGLVCSDAINELAFILGLIFRRRLALGRPAIESRELEPGHEGFALNRSFSSQFITALNLELS
jgi:hypothetical protein